jgi:hypothetical protein
MSRPLSGFHILQLKSERVRAIGMLLVLAVVAMFGVYYLWNPDAGPVQIGITIIVFTLIFAAFEIMFLYVVQRNIRECRNENDRLRDVELFVESVLPVIAMGILMGVANDPFVVLLSPAYVLIIIIIAASSLRLNPRLTLYAGILSSLCYAGLVLKALYVDDIRHLNPHPDVLYINMAVMLLVMTLVMYFITRQLRSYVDAAVQEMVLQSELELASEVQSNLLPSPLPELHGYEIAAFSIPAKHTGGDYYDCLVIDAQKTILMIADVTGHGVGPSLMTASSRAYFRAILEQQSELSEIIQQANRLLQKDLCSGHFVTLAAMILDSHSHRVQFLSAGHGPTLVVRHQEGSVEELPAQSIPLGIDVPLPLENVLELELLPGDMVAMFSDGCSDSRNTAGEAFGLERLTGLLKLNRAKPAHEIAAIYELEVKKFSENTPQADDMTMLLLKRAG